MSDLLYKYRGFFGYVLAAHYRMHRDWKCEIKMFLISSFFTDKAKFCFHDALPNTLFSRALCSVRCALPVFCFLMEAACILFWILC